MKKEGIIVLIVFVIWVCYFITNQLLLKKYTRKLTDALMNKSKDFNELIDSKIVKFLFDAYNREYMRLNYYISNGSKKEVKDQITKIDAMHINNNQRNALYQSALQYFISIGDEIDALKIQKKYNEFIDKNKLDPQMKENMEMEIKMYFYQSVSTLPYINKKLENCNQAEKAIWNLKKAYILKANNKLEEAKDCIRIVIDNTLDLQQKKTMQELLDNNLKDL